MGLFQKTNTFRWYQKTPEHKPILQQWFQELNTLTDKDGGYWSDIEIFIESEQNDDEE